MYQYKPTRELAEHVRWNVGIQFASVHENTSSFVVTGEVHALDDFGMVQYRSPVKIILHKRRSADQFTLRTPGFAREMKRDGHYSYIEDSVMEALDSYVRETA